MTSLPKGFEDLTRFVPEWALPHPLDRQRKRAGTDMAALRIFYNDLFPHLDRIFLYLKTVSIDGMTQADKNLYNLGATWMEMSHPIDLGWNETDESGAFPFERVELRDNSPARS
jgi:hypothetical protein